MILQYMKSKKGQRFKAGRCIHCLEQSEQINDDHIFPSAWYPDDTPSDVERWTVPSCLKCNKDHGINEQELLIRLGLCISPQDARACGVAAKALRSITPAAGKSERDKRARQAKRREILKDVELQDKPPEIGIFPNFGPDPSISYENFMVLTIKGDRLIKLGKKIVRGLTYHFENRFIENDREEIEVHFVHDRDAVNVVEMAKRFGQSFHRGPGISVIRAIAGDGSNAGIFIVEIWGRVKFYVTLLPRNE